MSNLTPNDSMESMLPSVAGPGLNQGSVAIEVARAVAETKGKLQVAKMFPRDINGAHRELMDACRLPSLAGKAFYSVPRANGKVTGPSVRLAEEIARCWGNIDYGHRELSRTDGKSEVEVYAWDMQTNLYSRRQLTVLHVMDTRDGPRKLRDQKDIDDKISNVASKQLRGRILAVLPKWLVADAEEACRATLANAAGDEPISSRVRKMLAAFAPMGVNQVMIEAYIEHPLENATPDDLVALMGVYTSIAEGGHRVDDYFDLQVSANPSAGVNALIGIDEAKVIAQTQHHEKTGAPAPAPAPRQAGAAVTRRTRSSSQPAAEAAPPPPPPAPAEPDENEAELGGDDRDGGAAAGAPAERGESSPPPAGKAKSFF